MANLRAGLVGFGLAGQMFHGPLIATTDGLELAVIVSRDPAKVHARFPGTTTVGTFDALLCDSSIDLVVVASPDEFHHGQTLAALDAGKHVVVDKPFALTFDEAHAMSRRARQRGKLLSVFHNRRWDADFVTLKQLIGSGALGEVTFFESHFDRYRPEMPTRWKDQRRAGVWQDLGPHLVDQALQLFGRPLAIFADLSAQKPNGLVIDYAHILLRYERMRAIVHISQTVPDHALRFVVHGTGGSYIKHGLDRQESQAKAGMSPVAPGWGNDPDKGMFSPVQDGAAGRAVAIDNLQGNYQAYYHGVRDAILGVGPNPVPPEQALSVMEILDAGLESVRLRSEIELAIGQKAKVDLSVP